MDLKVTIQQELWEIIEKNYENESYSSAILDAIHLLTDTIRNKTGLEGDGSSLIGQAFGGENPKIQLNKLQTESEKNVQKGIQDLLRGLFTAIRNPRSHDKHTDSKAEADAIIHFIHYLLTIIDQSRLSFEESNFLNRVFEKYYVRTTEYSDLLVNEIPKRQRVNIAIAVILQRKNGDIHNLSYFLRSLMNRFEISEIAQVYKIISEELKYTESEEEIRTILRIAPGQLWGFVDKVVRLRIENILFESVKAGKYDLSTKKCRFGALGTWIETEHLMEFDDHYKWTSLAIDKLTEGNDDERNYVKVFLLRSIFRINYNNINFFLEDYLRSGLLNKDKEVIELVGSQIRFNKDHPWWKVFELELKEHPDIKYDESPF